MNSKPCFILRQTWKASLCRYHAMADSRRLPDATKPPHVMHQQSISAPLKSCLIFISQTVMEDVFVSYNLARTLWDEWDSFTSFCQMMTDDTLWLKIGEIGFHMAQKCVCIWFVRTDKLLACLTSHKGIVQLAGHPNAPHLGLYLVVVGAYLHTW